MDQVKSWITSKTIWAAAIGVLLQVLTLAGVHLPVLDVNEFAGQVVNVVSGVLYAIAIYGRATAKTKLI